MAEIKWNPKKLRIQFVANDDASIHAGLPVIDAMARRFEMFDSYGFIACDTAQTNPEHIVQKHRLKGEKERHFSEVLTGLDLHRPPCHSPTANRAYQQIAALAYNLIIAVRLLVLDDEQQAWRLRTMMKNSYSYPISSPAVHDK